MSALALRIVACICMLLDHIGYCFAGRYPILAPLRWIGRIAFPLYVFLIVNGFRHTSNRLRYALRLFLFAVLSQVPFALLFHRGDFFGKYNVFFTLLLALLAVWGTDALRKRRVAKYFAFLPTALLFSLYYFGVLSSDYGAKGILLAMVFYLFEGRFILNFFGMLVSIYYSYLIAFGFLLLNLLRRRPFSFPEVTPWTLTQLFSLLSLVFVFLYNGKRGRLPQSPLAKKAIQLGFYGFYPVHLLVLYALRIVFLR